MTIAVDTAPRTLVDTLPRPSDHTAAILRNVALVVGFAILTAVFAQIRFNLSFTPVPITGQTFAVLLAGAALGWQRGMASQAVYWAAGIFMPVAWYAGDDTGTSITAGWNMATGTTAGYLLGFVVAAGAVGYLAERGQDREFATSIPAMLAGTAIIYACGATGLVLNLGVPLATGDPNAISLGVTPFLVGDVLKFVLAGLLTPIAWRAIERR